MDEKPLAAASRALRRAEREQRAGRRTRPGILTPALDLPVTFRPNEGGQHDPGIPGMKRGPYKKDRARLVVSIRRRVDNVLATASEDRLTRLRGMVELVERQVVEDQAYQPGAPHWMPTRRPRRPPQTSPDQQDVVTGYDFTRRVWLRDGQVVNCGHADHMAAPNNLQAAGPCTAQPPPVADRPHQTAKQMFAAETTYLQQCLTHIQGLGHDEKARWTRALLAAAGDGTPSNPSDDTPRRRTR